MLTPLKDLLGLPPSKSVSKASSNLVQWLGLYNIPNMGYIRLSQLAQKLGCELSDIPLQPAQHLKHFGVNDAQIHAMLPSNHLLKKQYRDTCDWLSKSNQHSFIGLSDSVYPPLLKMISRPPLFLFISGNTDLLTQPSLAIVGSRKPSIYATQATYELVQSISKETHAITVSGVALGIDAACHKASLANNLATIGVLGCGVDVVYPKRHRDLYQSISQSGALVSEFPLGTQPVASMFPRRNRIISGISLGTVVMEAKIKSGSLVTAKYAVEQNREVFALPNNITNPNAEGCHWLIKQGAQLMDGIVDVINELPTIAVGKTDTCTDKKNKKNHAEYLASDLLLDSVGCSVTSVDEIAKRSGMSLPDVLLQLLEYEMRGIVASTAEGYIKLRG